MGEEDQVQEQTLDIADAPAADADAAPAEENQNQQVNNDSEISKRSLSFKLKIPTKATTYHHHLHPQFMEEEEEDLPQQHQQRGALRTCSECGKQFSSGKALGGHKRACLQKIKNHNSGNTNQKPKIKDASAAVKLDGDNTNDQENNICYVCHQSFRSVKSLYGHMRKHPEREWRGVQPPKRLLTNHHQSASGAISPTPVSHDNDYDYDGGGGDLVEPLKEWSVKRKRDQRLIMSSSSSSDGDDQDEEEAMQQAVNDLLLLAQLSANDCAAMSKMNNNSSVGSGNGVLKINEKRVLDDGEKKVNVKMKDDGLGFDDCNSEDTWIVKKDYDDDDDDDTEEIDTMMMMNQQKKNNKKRRLDELDDASMKEEPKVMMATTTQTYSCPICNKSFDKHQALGGHVASHNKNKNVKESSSASASAAATAMDSKAEEKANRQVAASDEETGASSRVAAAAAGSSEHKCNICNKTFPTGQALGGHKRCHWTGPAEALSSSSQVTTSASEVTQRAPSSHRVVHDFDLNETPPEYYQFHGVEADAAAVS